MFWVPIDRKLSIPLIKQVYGQFRSNILNGKLQKNERLPSTRELATTLEVSRNVIIEAYEQLLAEGFIVSYHGSGTYVADGAYLQDAQAYEPLKFRQPSQATTDSRNIIDFRTGIPALDQIPRKKMAQLLHNICLEASSTIFSYTHPEGCLELRQTLCRYLLRTRGVQCTPEQLVITSGAIQGIFLIAKLLLSPGNEVIAEDPIHYSIRNTFRSFGARIHFVPVDAMGIDTTQIPPAAQPRIIFITPSHQFPLGGILPIQRRIELIRLADKTGSYIIEDDYDGEFRFKGGPISSLQGLNPDRVIYLGTFSKILAPSLRVGYLVLPAPLAEACQDLKIIVDRHSATLEQLMLARFIDEGHLENHVAKMKKLYQRRQLFLSRCLAAHFGSQVRISGNTTGLHLVAEFDNVVFDDSLVSRLEKAGVRIYPVEMYAETKGMHLNKLVLGYSNLSEVEIADGVNILKQVLG